LSQINIIITVMVKRVFVRVVGFSPVERHALNTIFRLSQEPNAGREISYEPWQHSDPDAATLVMIDGADASAAQELSRMHTTPDTGLIWVGAISPANAWRTFQRPLRWPDVLTAMDMFFVPPSSLDIDLDSDSLDAQIAAVTQPAPLNAFDAPTVKRALIADLDRDARFYLRTKLAAVGVTSVDEATSVAQAKELMAAQHYHFVSIDLSLTDLDPWLAIASAAPSSLRMVTAQNLSMGAKLSAKVNGCSALEKPLHPGKLQSLLQIL
jgi:CheY-like chemotaxis protein